MLSAVAMLLSFQAYCEPISSSWFCESGEGSFEAPFVERDSVRVEMMPLGDFDTWMVHEVNESGIIGGNTAYVYEIAEGDTLRNNMPFVPGDGTPWATSSAMAHVKGVYKASTTVFPEERGDGYCVRMETRIELVQVLGFINLQVLATGTIYTGETIEPIRKATNPQGNVCRGVPFTERPTALIFDYKVDIGGEQYRTSPNGVGKPKCVGTQNHPEVYVLLQHRWEDESGNLYADRVGTAYISFDENAEEWVNDFRLPIFYGDYSKEPGFREEAGLNDKEETEEIFYAYNSRGECVMLHEVGWNADEEPTDIIIIFTSGNGGAYIGAPDSKFWVDNARLEYGAE